MRANTKAWLDDFNLHAKTETELLRLLEIFFKICSERRLLISIKKNVLFAKELKWCGCHITADGYTMDSANIEGLENMAMPITAAELAQFVYCCRWMSLSIPDFNKRVTPLTEVMGQAYVKSRKQTTRSKPNIPLSILSWGPKHEQVFIDLQDSMENAVRLSYPNLEKVLCTFADASNRFRSQMVTQTNRYQLSLPIEKQKHEPLAFLGSSFKKAEFKWTTLDKEAFALFQTFEKVDYLFSGRSETRVFTDHRNLLFAFPPLALEPSLGRHIVSKVQRWAFYLSHFKYIIEHVKGEDNVFADILTRWARGYRQSKSNQVLYSLVLDEADQLVPRATSFPWSDIETMHCSQQSSNTRRGFFKSEIKTNIL